VSSNPLWQLWELPISELASCTSVIIGQLLRKLKKIEREKALPFLHRKEKALEELNHSIPVLKVWLQRGQQLSHCLFTTSHMEKTRGNG